MNTPLAVREKLISLVPKNGEERKIVVTHVTVRQSITFLILRMIVIELLAASLVIIFHLVLTSTDIQERILGNITLFNIPLFIVLVSLKTALMYFVIFQWLEEYYEITPKEITHKKGLIIKNEERHLLHHLGGLRVQQGLLGRIFNYGSIRLFNWAIEKEVSLYLIHNPLKYQHILESLLPEADETKQVIREHILEKERI